MTSVVIKLRYILFFFLSIFGLNVQAASNVRWSAGIVADDPETSHIILSAEVDRGYHFYAFAPEGGINSLEIDIDKPEGVVIGDITPSIEPATEYSQAMGQTLAWWGENVQFSIPLSLGELSGAHIGVNIRYQYCDDTQCYTPKREHFDLIAGDYDALVETPGHTEGTVNSANNVNSVNIISGGVNAKWWEPVETESPASNRSPWAILILGFLGGLAALLTPCVWPMIPMTLSFFLKKGKATTKSKRDAVTYGLSIIVIYVVIGLAITLIFGAGKLNELSTSALFNLIFFALLVIFAISFFGAFDIKLPSKWSTAIDNKAENTTGLISIFFMAFTLVLVSFSCTGPIIGTLLVEAASNGNILGPALGMGGFALGLALPFSVFALFPSMLKEMPKSGGWLNTVKVVLGFIELILSLKFLSVADMAYGWHILDREVFVALWIVLFMLMGMYLLGKLRFAHDGDIRHVGIVRFFLALFSFAFAVYLLPGMWGAPLKAVSAFVPPLETQDFNLYTHQTDYVEFTDYDAGMQYAAENNLPVLLDFSGWGCVNCRNMEAEVFDAEIVRQRLADNFVVVKLMVDERQKLVVPMRVESGNEILTIETVGEKWSYLQSHKFNSNSQPYYIILDNEGQAMTQPVYYDNSIDNFVAWLDKGLDNYMK